MRVNIRESKSKVHNKIRKALQQEEMWWNTYYDNDGQWYDWRKMEYNYSYVNDLNDEPIPYCRQIDMESFRGADYIRDLKIRKLLKLDKDITPRFGDIIKFD